MNRILPVFMLFLLCCPMMKAQAAPADTIAIKQLIEKADKLGESNVNEAFKLFGEAEEQARNAGQKRLLAGALLAESYYRFSNGDYEKVVAATIEAGKIYHSMNRVAEEAKCHNREGLAYMYLNRYSAALRSLFITKSLAEKMCDRKLTAAVNNNIGLVYESLNDWDNALVYAQKSLVGKMVLKDTQGMANSYHNIANLYYYQSRSDSALAYFRLAEKYIRLANNPYQLATLQSDMGNYWADIGQPDSAIYYQTLAFAFHSSLKEERFVEWCHTMTSLGNAWLRKGNLKKAGGYLKECKTCEEAISDLAFLKGVYSFRSEYYTQTKNFSQATHYLQLLNTINDSILAKSDRLENQRIGIRYEFTQKAKEDSLQYQLEISKQQMSVASYRNKMYLLLVALLVIAGVAATIVRRVRTLQERKRRVELEKTRQEIAGDLHDDIGSTLSSIQIISSLAANQCADNKPLQQSIQRIHELSDKVASNMREVVWSVNPVNDNLEATTALLRKLAADILTPVRIPFTFIKDLCEPQKNLLPHIRKDVILFYKEALNNARKHSSASQVDINIQQEEAFLLLAIKDHGCGFDKETVWKGNGLNSMERRAKEMNGILSVHTKKGEGTMIKLQVPLP